MVDMIINAQNFAGALTELRESKGLSQRELAELSGIKQPTIARIENGRSNPQIDTITKLLEPMGYDISVSPREAGANVHSHGSFVHSHDEKEHEQLHAYMHEHGIEHSHDTDGHLHDAEGHAHTHEGAHSNDTEGHSHVDAHDHDHMHTHEGGHDHDHTHAHGHHHSEEARKKQVNRIAKATGHLQHVKRMIEHDMDCSDVLIQLAAVRSALNNLGKEIINEHMTHCITEAIESGDTESVREFQDAVKRFI